jgi:hypothetical protein
VSEAACPFCGAPFDSSFGAGPAPVPPAVRLSRAALVALGTGSITLAAACGGATLPIPPQDAGSSTAEAGTEYDANTAVPYGLPPFDASTGDDTGTNEPADAGPDTNGYALPYGAPPYGLPPGP